LDFTLEKNIDLYLAGGINPQNVGEIIKKYKPKLLDLSSGLELSPGKKDPQKIKDFFESLKQGEQQ